MSLAPLASNASPKKHSARLLTKSKKYKLKKKSNLSRQCCTRSLVAPNGAIISIEACAGWIFSNDAAAFERACEKAAEALEDYIPQP